MEILRTKSSQVRKNVDFFHKQKLDFYHKHEFVAVYFLWLLSRTMEHKLIGTYTSNDRGHCTAVLFVSSFLFFPTESLSRSARRFEAPDSGHTKYTFDNFIIFFSFFLNLHVWYHKIDGFFLLNLGIIGIVATINEKSLGLLGHSLASI